MPPRTANKKVEARNDLENWRTPRNAIRDENAPGAKNLEEDKERLEKAVAECIAWIDATNSRNRRARGKEERAREGRRADHDKDVPTSRGRRRGGAAPAPGAGGDAAAQRRTQGRGGGLIRTKTE